MSANKNNKYYLNRLTNGREYIYADFKEFEEKCYSYFIMKEDDYETIEEVHQKLGMIEIRKKTPFLMEEIYVWLGISRGTWNNYKERGQDFLTLITHVEEIIVGQKKRGAYVGIFNANIVKADIGLVDKQETELKGSLNIPNIPDIGNRQ